MPHMDDALLTTTPANARAPRLRRVLLAVGMASVAVSAVAAFGPNSRLAAPAAAAAAEGPAPSAPWTSLGSTEYFHTLLTTFDPKIPARPGDSAKDIAGMYRYPQNESVEQWLDNEGHGRTVRADGSIGDPDLFPGLIRDKRTGLIQGYGGYVNRAGAQVDNPPRHPIADQLKYPDTVGVTDRPRAGSPTSTLWMRQASGFVSDGARAYRLPGTPAGRAGAQAQVDAWGASLRDLHALDGLAGTKLRVAVRALVAKRGRNDFAYPLPGAYDVTQASLARSLRVVRALKLLGSAPLPLAARQELFAQLAAEPGAKRAEGAADRAGRSGTRLTFDTAYSRDLPARRITGSAAWRLAGGTGPVPPSVRATYDLKAYHAERRWYVDLVFDRASGELLQYAYYSRWRNNGRVPQVTGPYRHPSGIKFHSGESQGVTDSALYTVRERTTTIMPTSPVCGVDPTPCARAPKELTKQ
ncbi:MAG: hypothetical protein JWN72_1872 [Thermoleophilia bacterium]|nr:hypothetical protein [Thermoleophilia bacterium]